jgi:hypothetical protein
MNTKDFSLLDFRETNNLTLNNEKGTFASHISIFLKEDFKNVYIINSDNPLQYINKIKELFLLSDAVFFYNELILNYDKTSDYDIVASRDTAEHNLKVKIDDESFVLEYFKLENKFIFNIRYNQKSIDSLPKLVSEYIDSLLSEEIFSEYSVYRTDEMYFTLNEFLVKNKYILEKNDIALDTTGYVTENTYNPNTLFPSKNVCVIEEVNNKSETNEDDEDNSLHEVLFVCSEDGLSYILNTRDISSFEEFDCFEIKEVTEGDLKVKKMLSHEDENPSDVYIELIKTTEEELGNNYNLIRNGITTNKIIGQIEHIEEIFDDNSSDYDDTENHEVMFSKRLSDELCLVYWLKFEDLSLFGVENIEELKNQFYEISESTEKEGGLKALKLVSFHGQIPSEIYIKIKKVTQEEFILDFNNLIDTLKQSTFQGEIVLESDTHSYSFSTDNAISFEKTHKYRIIETSNEAGILVKKNTVKNNMQPYIDSIHSMWNNIFPQEKDGPIMLDDSGNNMLAKKTESNKEEEVYVVLARIKEDKKESSDDTQSSQVPIITDETNSVEQTENVESNFMLIYPFEQLPAYVSTFVNTYSKLTTLLEKETFVERYLDLLKCYNILNNNKIESYLIPEDNSVANNKVSIRLYENQDLFYLIQLITKTHKETILENMISKNQRINRLYESIARGVFMKYLHFDIETPDGKPFSEKVKFEAHQYSIDEMIQILDDNSIPFRNDSYNIQVSDFEKDVLPNIYFNE